MAKTLNLAKLKVLLLGDSKSLKKGLKEGEDAGKKFSKNIKKVVAGGMAVAFALALNEVKKFVSESNKEFGVFDEGIREVFTLMPGMSQMTMDAMGRDVLAYGTKVGRLSDDVIPALYQSISAGVPKENVFNFLETAHAASLGGVTDLEVAVDGITSVVNAYGSEVVSATEASDLMFTAVKGGKCLTGDTRVLQTDGRYERIDQLQTGGIIVSYDGRNFVPMAATWVDRGVKPTAKIVTHLGREITTTWNHPYLARSSSQDLRSNEKPKWVKVKDLQPGDRIAVPTTLPFFGSEQPRRELAAMLGLWLAEGSRGSSPKITTSQYGEQVKQWARVLGCSARNVEKREGMTPQYQITASRRGGHPSTRPKNTFAEWLKQLGLGNSTAKTKHVPSTVFTWDRDSITVFLHWLFNGDGWLCRRLLSDGKHHGFELGFVSASKRLVEDVSHLLLRFGVVGRIRQRENCWIWTTRRYEEIRRFVDFIGIDRPDADLVHEHDPQKGKRMFGVVEFDPIVSIEARNDQHVYDLTVPGLENFVANDIVAHNTDFQQLASRLFQVVPIASALNLEFGNVTAALAAMTAQGTPTRVAATQLRSVLIELSKSGGETAVIFERLTGKTFKEFIAEGGNLQEALQVLEQYAQETNVGVNDMFGSIEAGMAALTLTGKGTQKYTDELAAAEDAQGATAEAADTMGESILRTEERVEAAKEQLQILIGEGLAPTKKSFDELKLAILEAGVAAVSDSNLRKAAIQLGHAQADQITDLRETWLDLGQDLKSVNNVQTEFHIASLIAKKTTRELGEEAVSSERQFQRLALMTALLGTNTKFTTQELWDSVNAMEYMHPLAQQQSLDKMALVAAEGEHIQQLEVANSKGETYLRWLQVTNPELLAHLNLMGEFGDELEKENNLLKAYNLTGQNEIEINAEKVRILGLTNEERQAEMALLQEYPMTAAEAAEADRIHAEWLAKKNDELERAAEIQARVNEIEAIAAERMAALSEATTGYYNAALPAIQSTDENAIALYEAAKAAGADHEQLIILGGALDLYDDKAMEAALRTAMISAKIKILAEDFVAGNISIGGMKESLTAFISGLDETAVHAGMTAEGVSEVAGEAEKLDAVPDPTIMLEFNADEVAQKLGDVDAALSEKLDMVDVVAGEIGEGAAARYGDIEEAATTSLQNVSSMTDEELAAAAGFSTTHFEDIAETADVNMTASFDSVAENEKLMVKEMQAGGKEILKDQHQMWGEALEIVDETMPEIVESLGLGLEDAHDEGIGWIPEYHDMGLDLIMGTAGGVTDGSPSLSQAVRAAVAAAIAAGRAEAEATSPSRVMYILGEDMIEGFVLGLEDSEGEAITTMEGIVGSLLGLASTFSRAGTGIAREYERQVLDPLAATVDSFTDEMDASGDIIRSLTGLSPEAIAESLGGFGLDYGFWLAAEEQLGNEASGALWDYYQIQLQRNEAEAEYAEQQERLLELQHQQQQLGFLQTQLDLIQSLQEQGIDAAAIFEGMTLGLDANVEDMLDIMNAAMAALIGAADAELGIASPSQVFEEKGRLAIQGFAKGIFYESKRQLYSVMDSFEGIISATPMPEFSPVVPSVPMPEGGGSNAIYVDARGAEAGVEERVYKAVEKALDKYGVEADRISRMGAY